MFNIPKDTINLVFDLLDSFLSISAIKKIISIQRSKINKNIIKKYNIDSNTSKKVLEKAKKEFVKKFMSSINNIYNNIVEDVKPRLIKKLKSRVKKTQPKQEVEKQEINIIEEVEKLIKEQEEKEALFKKEEKEIKELMAKFEEVKPKKSIKYVSHKFTKIKFFTKYNFTYKNVEDLEDLFKAIKDSDKRIEDIFTNAEGENIIYNPTAYTFFFKNIDTGKIIGRWITANYLYDYNDFETVINELLQGNSIAGSDPMSANEYELILNTFGANIEKIKGESNSQKVLFNCVGINNKDGFCGYNALLKCGYKYNGYKKDLNDLDNLINYIYTNNLNINILSNGFTIKDNTKNIIDKGVIERKLIKNEKGFNKLYITTKLKNENINLCYLHDINNDRENTGFKVVENTIIYDEFNEHFDVITDNKISLRDDIYISLSNEILKGDEVIFKPRQINENTKKKAGTQKFKYLFFDYETVINFNSSTCMNEYSLSILILDEEELKLLNEADLKKDIDTVNIIREINCKTFLGFDCSNQFIEWLTKNENDTTYKFIGFNNSNFDNFILLNALLKYNEDNINLEINVNNIFYNNNCLLNFYINGRHNFFDIRKHLTGTLKNCCKSFKINVCGKLDFDHNKAQKLYEENKLIEFITDNDELKKYNEYDVLSTSILYYRYQEALINIPSTCDLGFKLFDNKTIGGLIYKVFEEQKNKLNFILPKLDLKQYQDLQKYKIAGRVEMFNNKQKVNERLVSTDVCSLYPFVMSVLNVYYPYGNIIKTKKYKKDKIGFYYCDIDQSNLKKCNLPNIYAEKLKSENKWDSENELEDYLISNVMIELLLKYGCKVIIKNGFYFTNEMKSSKMFEFLLELMKEKNKQDTYKDSKEETEKSKYNSALRETMKLLMNSLSGKVIEGLHTEKISEVGSVYDYKIIKDKAKKMNTINNIGNKLFVSYEIDEKDLLEKQRPIYLGVLIYDYAKRYMYENSYSKIGLNKLLYTDTDATKFRHTDFIKWKNEIDEKNIIVPHWEEVEKYDERYKTHKIYDDNSKVFGSYEDELKEMIGDKYHFYCLQKKSWFYSADNNQKFRFKGLNPNSQFIEFDNKIVDKKIMKHKDGSETVKYILNIDDKERYNYYVENKNNSLDNNALKFFDDLYKNNESLVICSSFRRIVKNSLRDVENDDNERFNKKMNRIQANISVKHVKLT